MEEENLYEVRGFYEPGLFHLRLNTTDDLTNLNELKRDKTKIKYYSSFFHEYIHFLQDVTTTSGLANVSFFIDHIKYFNKVVLNDNSSTFKVPIEISNEANTLTNISMRSIINGENIGYNRVLYSHYEGIPQKVTDNQNTEHEINSYKIHFLDCKTMGNKSLLFGVRNIKEFMTHSLQNILFPGTEHDDIPYVIVELMLKKELPKFAENQSNIIALCDAVQMSVNPTDAFFMAIETLKILPNPSTPEEVYDIVYGCVYKDQIEPPSQLIENNYIHFHDLAKKQFQNAFASPFFNNNREWITKVLDNAMKIRFGNRSFILHLIDGPNELSQLFLEIFKSLGTPFITNKSGAGWFYPPEELNHLDIASYYPLVFKSILGVYYGHFQCALINFCKHSKDGDKIVDITNQKCIQSPWLRVNDIPPCAFGALWKTWGLENEIPEK